MAKMTREEHIRMQRRRGRQFTGLVVILLVVLGAISMISWAVKGVAALTIPNGALNTKIAFPAL